ncbi:IclR family transcriptional regulator [Microbacterium panaciterrae]|uniref:Allantoin degradation transcriptional regulator AllR n=1 Tax=Microbacterium panaciterrae TaxID=985759 RepID=A0ABP8P5S9_9MICO
MAAKAPTTVQSVTRVFDLLELIADAGGYLTISQIAPMAGLPLTTTHRLLQTLIECGYLRQLSDRSYALGPRLVRLGEIANRQFGAIAMPQLKSLVASLGETANLATLDGDRVVYLSQAPSPHAMRMFTEVGGRAHLHSTGVGKAILAQLTDAQVRTIAARTGLPSSTPQSIVSIEVLLEDLALTRERGYAIDDGEHEIGVRCYATIVPHMSAFTALSVSVPMSRVDDRFAERAVPLMHATAAEISAVANAV